MNWLTSLKQSVGRLRFRLGCYRELRKMNRSETHRYFAHSATLKVKSRETLQGLIIRKAHGLEVGLTYKPFRPGSGQQLAIKLIELLLEYSGQFSADQLVHHSVETLVEYCKKQAECGRSVPDIEASVKQLCQISGTSYQHTPRLKTEQYQHSATIRFDEFARNRRSCREYLKRPVDHGILEEAIETALGSPSACNRQPCRVYVVQDPEARREVLELQNNRSKWRSDAGQILVVTVDQGFYSGVREMNAAYVDGGLFCMTLSYALHAKGLGACMLNLNLSVEQLNRMRRVTGASDGEVIIMMIATGYAKATIPVCRKFRRPVSDVLQVVGHGFPAREGKAA